MFAPSTRKIELESSALAWARWSPGHSLELCWRDVRGNPGPVYRYSPVDPTLFERFLKSPSKGRFAAWVIKKQCRAEGPL